MTTTRYLWNPINQNIIREYDGTGNTVASYTTEPDLYGDVVSQRRSGQDSVYHYDGQGSALALTDANGVVTDTYAYSAFGEVTARTGSTANPCQFVGQKQYYRDAETGHNEVRRRQLSPEYGRWMCVDPIAVFANDEFSRVDTRADFGNKPLELVDLSELQTQFGSALGRMRHLYEYCGNNPITRIDPLGTFWVTPGPLFEEAQRRRGSRGPGDDSSHHCWAVCEWSIRLSGFIPLVGAIDAQIQGCVNAIVGDALELPDWIPKDSPKDIKANHQGSDCAFLVATTSKWFYSCDSCCGTKPK